jgi:hypothetical protein
VEGPEGELLAGGLEHHVQVPAALEKAVAWDT